MDKNAFKLSNHLIVEFSMKMAFFYSMAKIRGKYAVIDNELKEKEIKTSNKENETKKQKETIELKKENS